jgi:hypothetical protein
MHLLTAMVLCRRHGMMAKTYNISVWIKAFDPWFVYPPAMPVDVMVIPRASEKSINSQINGSVSRAMAGRFLEPYYFSTRWNTNGTNIPSFHHSIVPLFQFFIVPSI